TLTTIGVIEGSHFMSELFAGQNGERVSAGRLRHVLAQDLAQGQAPDPQPRLKVDDFARQEFSRTGQDNCSRLAREAACYGIDGLTHKNELALMQPVGEFRGFSRRASLG